jgi:hypothetical protein
MMHKSGGTIAGTSAQEQLYVSIWLQEIKIRI